jgi:hypothetical protein
MMRVGWILAPRVVEPRYDPPPPPPRACYRIIPGHCEDRWDPYWGVGPFSYFE